MLAVKCHLLNAFSFSLQLPDHPREDYLPAVVSDTLLESCCMPLHLLTPSLSTLKRRDVQRPLHRLEEVTFYVVYLLSLFEPMPRHVVTKLFVSRMS